VISDVHKEALMKTLTLEEALAAKYPFEAKVYEDGTWGLDFPDLDGLSGYAETWEEIGPAARESVRVHIEAIARDGDPIPAPTVEPDYVLVSPDSPLSVILPEYSDGEWAYMTTAMVAKDLELSEDRVRKLAASRGLGRKWGRDYFFTESDLEAMKIRKPGRPKKSETRRTAAD
jgi:predicted RNase H-like HicB family nuclease